MEKQWSLNLTLLSEHSITYDIWLHDSRYGLFGGDAAVIGEVSYNKVNNVNEFYISFKEFYKTLDGITVHDFRHLTEVIDAVLNSEDDLETEGVDILVEQIVG